MFRKINEVAKLTGITVRTLHYYDEIGLLRPSSISTTGYRLYDNNDIKKLQQILFFRELNFSLKEIKEIIKNPNYNKTDALKNQKQLLLLKRKRLDGIIELVENAIKGENYMSFKEFDTTEIEKLKKEYAEESKERWGKTKAYSEYEKKSKNYDEKQWENINLKAEEILKLFANNMDKNPNSNKIQSLVKNWQDYITENFYICTKDILASLGSMYVNDKRFKNNIDKNGKGTAEFISKAIEIYCSK